MSTNNTPADKNTTSNANDTTVKTNLAELFKGFWEKPRPMPPKEEWDDEGWWADKLTT